MRVNCDLGILSAVCCWYDNLFHAAERELDLVKRAALFIAMNGCR
jgi:hypothetical protein